MANDEQQEGLSAQERLARLYSARAEGQQEDATSFAGETAGVSISSEVPQAQTVSTQERLDRLRARRAGVPLPGDPEAATPVNNEGANRPRFNINLSRIVDAIPTIVRFFPAAYFYGLGALLGLVPHVLEHWRRRCAAYGASGAGV